MVRPDIKDLELKNIKFKQGDWTSYEWSALEDEQGDRLFGHNSPLARIPPFQADDEYKEYLKIAREQIRAAYEQDIFPKIELNPDYSKTTISEYEYIRRYDYINGHDVNRNRRKY